MDTLGQFPKLCVAEKLKFSPVQKKCWLKFIEKVFLEKKFSKFLVKLYIFDSGKHEKI